MAAWQKSRIIECRTEMSLSWMEFRILVLNKVLFTSLL